MYANKEDALNDKNVLDTQTTNEKGIATFKNDIYYGRYIKESRTIENYQIRNKEKDIISVDIDNGVRFLGEIEPKNMKVTSINQDGKEKTLDSNKNVNQELQRLVYVGYSFNDNTNWLVFNDNGTEKLIAKKPLKSYIAWNSLYNAGLVFDENGARDADFSDSNYGNPPWGTKMNDTDPNNYKPTYVTVNGKKYIVRLMRAYNENAKINDNKSWGSWDSDTTKSYTKGSEWNRLILPLIDPTGDNSNTGYDKGTNGRYGSRTKDFVERNMPTLANYSWWTDFGGNNDGLGEYDKGNNHGAWRWMQETGYEGSRFRSVFGCGYSNCGAGNASSIKPYYNDDSRGWQPVLELVN